MSCFYEHYIQQGGLCGTMSEARKAEFLRAHQRHHANCRPFRQADLDQLSGMFTTAADSSGGRAPSACRVCGAADCAKPECLRAILAAEENLMFRQRLAQHASAAARDAAGRRNGHATR